MATPRRDFLSMLGFAGLGAGSGPFDAPEVDGGGDPFVPSDKWDMTWIKRVRGKARGVFDLTTTDSNGGWGRVMTWHDHAVEVYQHAKDVSTVAVLRHGAISLAMNDAYWEEFRSAQTGRGGRGAGSDSAAASVAPTTPVTPAIPAPAPAAPLRNPIGTPRSGATDVQKAHTIEGFLAAGGIVLACNVAFTGIIRPQIARGKQLTGDAADRKAREYLIPGVILMPSGVFALIAAQQAGCGMCAALVPSSSGAS